MWWKKTDCCGANAVGVGCASPPLSVAGWLRGRTEWAVRPCTRSPRSRHPTPEGDLRANTWPARRASRDPSARCADGDRESDLGLHADPRRAGQRGPSRRPLDYSTDPAGGGIAAGPAAPDLVADVVEGPLGSDRRCRFLHHRRLDLAGAGDVLHGVRDRPGVPPRSDPRRHGAPGGAVHAAGITKGWAID